MALLLSVNVGLPRDIEWQGRTVHTAVWKAPVQGRKMARRLNMDGDGQGDLVGHGGEHRAVFVYQIESYRYWQNQLGRDDFTYGQFGENFTIEGLPDTEVCIGDHYRIGDALFEVTQPRITCYRVGIRMNEPQMAALLTSHGRPGFYFRVLEEGEVGTGDEISKVKVGPEHMTVAEINALLYLPGHPASKLERALRIPALSAGWRASLDALLNREQRGGGTTGNPGLGPPQGPPPAWQGFRPLRVTQKLRESDNVTSLVLEPTDSKPLTAAPAGQFIVLRVRPGPDEPALLRSYSLSGEPSEDQCQTGAAWRRRGLHRYAASARRYSRRERPARHLYVAAARWFRGPCQRRHRSNSGPRNAARTGRRAIAERDLVDSRRPQQQRTSVCSGGTRAPQDLAREPQPHLLHFSTVDRSAGCRFRQGRTRRHARIRRTGHPTRRGFLHLRPGGVYERSRH
jgi:MOSC domain-containing protein YiiM